MRFRSNLADSAVGFVPKLSRHQPRVLPDFAVQDEREAMSGFVRIRFGSPEYSPISTSGSNFTLIRALCASSPSDPRSLIIKTSARLAGVAMVRVGFCSPAGVLL